MNERDDDEFLVWKKGIFARAHAFAHHVFFLRSIQTRGRFPPQFFEKKLIQGGLKTTPAVSPRILKGLLFLIIFTRARRLWARLHEEVSILYVHSSLVKWQRRCIPCVGWANCRRARRLHRVPREDHHRWNHRRRTSAAEGRWRRRGNHIYLPDDESLIRSICVSQKRWKSRRRTFPHRSTS